MPVIEIYTRDNLVGNILQTVRMSIGSSASYGLTVRENYTSGKIDSYEDSPLLDVPSLQDTEQENRCKGKLEC